MGAKKETAKESSFTLHIPLRFKALVALESPILQQIILLLIMVNSAVLVFLSQLNVGSEFFSDDLYVVSRVIVVCFAVEVLVRLYAVQKRFFLNIWNVLDFFIVLASLYPPLSMLSILRVVRLLRVTNILSASPGGYWASKICRATVRLSISFGVLFAVFIFVYGLIFQGLLAEALPAHFYSFADSLAVGAQIFFLEWPSQIVKQAVMMSETEFNIYWLFASLWLIGRLCLAVFVLFIVSATIELVKEK